MARMPHRRLAARVRRQHALHLAPILALAVATSAAAATPSTFVNATRALGVATNPAGEVYVSYDHPSGATTFRSRLSAAAQELATVSVGGATVGELSHMDLDPATGVVWDLSNTGTVRQLDPATLQLLTPEFSLRQIPIDTTNTFDALNGDQRNMTAFVTPAFASYGDIAIARSVANRRLDMFASGKTSGNVKFVVRLTWIDNAYQGARAIIATSAISPTDTAVPGVAVNAAGTVMTTMANKKGSLVGTEFVPRAWIFSSAWPEGGTAPRLAFDGLDLSTTGMTTDASGMFYAVGPIGTSACGQNASGAIVMLLSDGRPYACQPNALLAAVSDIAVAPGANVAYTTAANAVVRWDRLPPPAELLTVRVSGPGTIGSSPSGISCPPTCSAPFARGQRVQLGADVFSTVEAWGDACAGSFLVCTVDMNGPVTASVVFKGAPQIGAPAAAAAPAAGTTSKPKAPPAPGPRIPALTITPASLRAGRNATVRYSLTRAATVRFTAERRRTAGKRGYIAVRGSLTKSGKAGRNSFRWNKRLGGKALRPGRYRLVATPAGGAPARAAFRIRG
jgi:hypothetical protein